MSANGSKREPLFHVSKKHELPVFKGILYRVIAIAIALVITGILGFLLIKENPFRLYATILKGPFIDVWTLLQNTAILLGFAIAVVPAFKMKYFNMGANGQVLVGCLAGIACMKFLTGVLPNWLVILLIVVASVAASVIFAVIPAIFKAYFDTNETLFTLMMNYIAVGLVDYLVFVWDKSGSGNIGIVNLFTHDGWFPNIGNKYMLSIIAVTVMTVFMWVYMKYTKHGFEASLVGESVNTAKYVGINVNKVIIRTLALSGILCGIIGAIYAGGIEHTVNSSVGGKGFTAILVAWMANFNPPVMALTSFLVVFLTSGTEYASSVLNLGSNDFASITVGIVFFCVIGAEFFARYKIELTQRGREVFRIREKNIYADGGNEK